MKKTMLWQKRGCLCENFQSQNQSFDESSRIPYGAAYLQLEDGEQWKCSLLE